MNIATKLDLCDRYHINPSGRSVQQDVINHGRAFRGLGREVNYGHDTIKAHREVSVGLDRCALGRIRTCNLLIRSQMLYPLSYERIVLQLSPHRSRVLRRLRDLNPGWG